MMFYDSPIPTLDPQSKQAEAITGLLIVTLLLAIAVVVIIAVMVTVTIIRFRRRQSNDQSEPRQISGSFRLELVWTAIPALVLIGLFFPTVGAMNASDPAIPANPQADIEIIGHQWWWEYRYPKQNIVTANVMYIPTGQKVLAKLVGADVIHDFWVPQLGRKMDVNPGAPNYEYLEADNAGVFHGACAEYCGTQHAWMLISVHAVPQAEYDKWLSDQAKDSTAALAASVSRPQVTSDQIEKGKQVFLNNTCVNCHSIAGTSANYAQVGPNLTHVGSREILGAGVIETPQDNQALALENMKSWVKNPQAIKPGVHMPPYLQLSDGDLTNLAAYLESLK
jgi:cytochrome c oxidase subunit 2